jgi:hypothetical protein
VRQHRRSKHRSGRPPAGVRSGERVKDYPQTSLRLPPEIKSRLSALSRAAGTPQWRVASAALECFFRERSLAEQRKVFADLSKRSRRP